jgi:hypothetical protein
MSDIHSCSYFCTRPACVLQQRDELRSVLALAAIAERQKRQAEPVVERDLLSETQAALRDSWAIIMKLKAVQDAARALVESDPDSAADTEGEAFTAWCVLVAAIDDADTLLCNFGESNAAM